MARAKREMSIDTRVYLRELRSGRASRIRHDKEVEAAEAAAAAWNAAYAVGTPVDLTRDDGSILETRTRTPAWALSSGDAVVSVVGISGGYLLSRVKAWHPCAIGEGCDCDGWHPRSR